MTRFRSIFDNLKLQASEKEFSLINRRFQAKAANEINYVEFDYVLRHYSGDLQWDLTRHKDYKISRANNWRTNSVV